MAAERRREGFSPEMLPVGAGRWFQGTSRQQRGVRQMASAPSPPGIEGPVELESRMCGNHGDPYTGALLVSAQFRTSLNSEDGTGGVGKSEAPIRAMISGSAEGAKGRRFETADE